MKRRIFCYLIRLNQRKKFSSHSRVSVYFLWTKKSKMEATTQFFRKQFFKQVLEFHRPSKLLCQTSGHQNHWFVMYRERCTLYRVVMILFRIGRVWPLVVEIHVQVEDACGGKWIIWNMSGKATMVENFKKHKCSTFFCQPIDLVQMIGLVQLIGLVHLIGFVRQ